MRLAVRFAAVLAAVMSVLLAVQGYLDVRRITALQEDETRQDLVLLTHSLATALGDVWAAAGERRAREFLDRADARRPGTELALVTDFSAAAVPADHSSSVERVRQSDAWVLRATQPIRVDDRVQALLRVDRHLVEQRKFLESVWTTQITTTSAAILCSGVISLWLGLWLIGKPIERLSLFAGRVAEGDFTAKADTGRQDELGQLAGRLESMAGRLAKNQERLREESRGRAAAHEQLRHADRLSTVGRIASSMAHELGTPLNVVSGRAAMISADDQSSEDARENARIISEQARRMTEIIRNLLDFARRKPLVRQDVRIGDLLARAESLLEPIAEDAHVTIHARGELDLVAPIDSGKTLQVLSNMIMNSIHAMPEGGRITLGVHRDRVEEPPDSHASAGDYVCVVVEDTGRGIPEEELPNIFKPFFTTKKSGKGTGLGLSVCHSIVREHGGWITVTSERDKGSRFVIYLPKREVL